MAKKGTLVIALKTKEGDVVVASDKLGIETGNQLLKMKMPKIVKRKGILIGDAGDASLCQVLENKIEELSGELLEKGVTNETRKKLRETFASAKQEYLKSLGKKEKAEVEALLVFASKGEVKILRINGGEEEINYSKFVAIGAGEDVALGISNLLLPESASLKLENAMKAAYLIVKITSKTCLKVGGGVDMWVYYKNGKINHLTQKEIREIREKAKELQKKIQIAVSETQNSLNFHKIRTTESTPKGKSETNVNLKNKIR